MYERKNRKLRNKSLFIDKYEEYLYEDLTGVYKVFTFEKCLVMYQYKDFVIFANMDGSFRFNENFKFDKFYVVINSIEVFDKLTGQKSIFDLRSHLTFPIFLRFKKCVEVNIFIKYSE
jgi:hypothetical protein